MSGWSVWLQFVIIAGAITVSGSRLSKYGDVLAEKTGVGRTWLGLVVLAAVTSLPELATGVSAILWVQAPDLTVGDLLGSCMFNLLILAVMDLFSGIPSPFEATRYHSLIVERESLPDSLAVSAQTAVGEIMGLRHRDLGVFGVQFHPESILTTEGLNLLRNFLKRSRG